MNRNRNLCKKKYLKMMGVLLASAVVASGTGGQTVYGAEKASRIEKSDSEIKDVIFLDGENGSDRNSGLDEEHAVKSFARAAKLAKEGWEIQVCGTVTVDGQETWKLPKGVSFGRSEDFSDDIALVNGSLTLKNVPVYESWISGEGTVEGALKESLLKVPSVITVETPVLLESVSLEQCEGEGSFEWAGKDRMLDQYETVCEVIFRPEDDQDYSQEEGWDEESETVIRKVTVQVLSLAPGDGESQEGTAGGDQEGQTPQGGTGDNTAGGDGSGQTGETGGDSQETDGSQPGGDSGEKEESTGEGENSGADKEDGSGGDSGSSGEDGQEAGGSDGSGDISEGTETPDGSGDISGGTETPDGSGDISGGTETPDGSGDISGGTETPDGSGETSGDGSAGESGAGESGGSSGTGTSGTGETEGEDGGQTSESGEGTGEGTSGEDGETSGESGDSSENTGESEDGREDSEEESSGLTEEEQAQAADVQALLEGLPQEVVSQDGVTEVVEATRSYLRLSDQQRALLSQEAVKQLEKLQQQAAVVNRKSGGVSIEGDLPWYVQLQAQKRSDTEDLSLLSGAGVDTLIYPYEIRLWDLMNQQEYKLNGQQVRLTMPVPDASSYSRLMVLHYLEDGSVEYITPVNNGDGTVSFLTTSFSPYSLAGSAVLVGNTDKLYQSGGNSGTGTSAGGSSSGKTSTGNTTGISSQNRGSSSTPAAGQGTSTGTSRAQAARTEDPQTPYLYAGLGVFAVVVLAGAAAGYHRSRRKQKEADETNQ